MLSCQIRHMHTNTYLPSTRTSHTILPASCVSVCVYAHAEQMPSSWCARRNSQVERGVERRGARKVRGGELGNRGDSGMERRRVGEKENSHFTGYCPSWYDRHQGAQTSVLAHEGGVGGGRHTENLGERRRDMAKQQRDGEISQLQLWRQTDWGRQLGPNYT